MLGALGLPFDGLQVSAKLGYREDRQAPGEFLSAEQIARIGEIFANELRLTPPSSAVAHG
ncbi:MAG: hypothetical protein R3316_07895 [Rhodovibrionaceae bacterium]|nr:hypothetical protein [Rhodovibrionaceae bacterium]